MKIETKFNVGDYVFYLENNSIKHGTIERIQIEVASRTEEGMINYGNIKPYIYSELYYLGASEGVHCARLIFKTKQELLDSL